MRRSKTEIFLDILKALALSHPLRVSHLCRKANVSHVRLILYMKFAMKSLVVNKRGCFYSITPLGLLLYKECRREQLLSKDLNEFFQKKGRNDYA